MEQEAFEVVEVHKITDTERADTYVLDITLSINGVVERHEEYLSSPTDPYGANPAIRLWMNQNPDAQVHPYVPPTPPTIEEIRAAMPTLTARQLRLGLVANSIAPSAVQATLDAMPDGTDREMAQIEWEYATTFNRLHPLIASVGAALGLSDEQIDAMTAATASL